MYVKNSNFYLNQCFQEKSCQIEKNWNSFAAAPPEKQAPSLLVRLPRDFQQLFSPKLLIFFKKTIDYPPI